MRFSGIGGILTYSHSTYDSDTGQVLSTDTRALPDSISGQDQIDPGWIRPGYLYDVLENAASYQDPATGIVMRPVLTSGEAQSGAMLGPYYFKLKNGNAGFILRGAVTDSGVHFNDVAAGFGDFIKVVAVFAAAAAGGALMATRGAVMADPFTGAFAAGSQAASAAADVAPLDIFGSTATTPGWVSDPAAWAMPIESVSTALPSGVAQIASSALPSAPGLTDAGLQAAIKSGLGVGAAALTGGAGSATTRYGVTIPAAPATGGLLSGSNTSMLLLGLVGIIGFTMLQKSKGET